jgi:opacity protein-like surface antigen
MARVTIADYTDTGSVNNNGAGFGAFPSFASAPAASKWNFAWALHTGLAYRVNPGLTLELAYSYVNLGSGTTGAVSDYTGFTRGVPMQFHDITSHDVKLGVRWDLNSPPAYAPPPLITKG